MEQISINFISELLGILTGFIGGILSMWGSKANKRDLKLVSDRVGKMEDEFKGLHDKIYDILIQLKEDVATLKAKN